MEKNIKKVFVIIIALIIFSFMIITISNNKKISQVERRELNNYPKFTIKSIISKKYYDDLTNAFKDQLAFRNSLVKGYFLFQFQHYYGDAVKGTNNELYSASQTKLSNKYYKRLKKVTKKVNDVANTTQSKFIFLSIPRKDAYMTKDLPKNYNSSLDIYKKQVQIVRNNLDKNIIFIDALDVFNSNDIYNCYYSNDHHITPRCGYLLYKEINKYTDVQSYYLEDEFIVGKTIVNGSYNRMLGQTVKSKPEDLYLIPKNNIKYTRYENEKLSNKEVYLKGNTYEDAYMGGDMAYTIVETNNKNNKKIMFVGSSYTNILEALFIPSYEKVVSIDYRHIKNKKSIDDYAKENDIDYIVFIPAQSTNSFSINKIKLYLGK